MLNLIKMDLYRLFHSKAIKIGMIAAALLAVLGLLLNLGILAVADFAMTESGDVESVASLSLFFPAVAWLEGTDYATIVFAGTGTFSLFVACMVSANFISSEQSCGYVKNIAGQLPDRSYTVISKFLVTALVNLIILVIYVVVSCIFAPIFFKKYIATYSIGSLIALLSLRLLLNLAINAVILFLCTLTKSQSLAMVIGAIFGIGITKLAYLALQTLLGVIKISFKISDYMPDGIDGLLSVETLGTLAPKAIIVSIVFMAVFLFGSIFLMKKRDVK